MLGRLQHARQTGGGNFTSETFQVGDSLIAHYNGLNRIDGGSEWGVIIQLNSKGDRALIQKASGGTAWVTLKNCSHQRSS